MHRALLGLNMYLEFCSELCIRRIAYPSGLHGFVTALIVPEFGQERRRIPLAPPPPDFRNHLFAIVCHSRNQRAGRTRLLMARCPNEQLQKHRRQINSLLRQPVVHSAPVRFLFFGGNDPGHLEPLQAVRQNVGGNSFARFLELLERPEPANHQVADDEQRPAISKPLERDTYRAAGTAF